MKNYRFLFSAFILSIFSFTSLMANLAIPQFHKWEKIGSKKINYKLDRDILYVGAKEGTYSKLKIEVKGNTVLMKNMIIEYNNGQKESIELRYTFTPNSTSRTIDLAGDKRSIKKIQFLYESYNNKKRKATINIFGKK